MHSTSRDGRTLELVVRGYPRLAAAHRTLAQAFSSRAMRSAWLLPVVALAAIAAVMNDTIMVLALPSVGKDLDMSNAALQWVNAANSIAFVSLLLPAGAMGDKFGSKLMMTLGLVTLGTCGGLGGMQSISSLQLICIRAGMGLAAALILPNSLSVLLRSTELDGHDKAIADWTLAVNTGQPIGMAIPFFIIGMRLPWLAHVHWCCLLYTSPSPRDLSTSRMPSSA